MKKLVLFLLISQCLFGQTVLPGKQGGTGVANIGKTITLGSSIITTGTATPTLAFPSTSRTFTFPDTADYLALKHWTIPRYGTISGYPLTGSIEFGTTNGSAISSTSHPFYLGYGNALSLSSATAKSYINFDNDYTAIGVNNSSNDGATIEFGSNFGTYSASINAISGGLIKTQLVLASDNTAVLTGAAGFPGLQYAASYSGNYTVRSLIDKGYADGRYALTNATFTVNGTGMALGTSSTITANTTNALTAGTGLAFNSGTTFDGSAAKTLSVSLAAGTGISVSSNTISTNLVAGTGISISTNTISGNYVATAPVTISSNTIVLTSTGTGSVVLSSGATLTTPTLGVASATSLSLTGAGGAGYLSLPTQTATPSAPSSGTLLFSNSNSKFSWRGSANTYVKTFDGSSATADRVYSLPDVTGSVALIDGGQTFTSAIWNGTKISEVYGGTNQSTYAAGDILYASGVNTLSKLAGDNTGVKKVLNMTSNVPSWALPATINLTAVTQTTCTSTGADEIGQSIKIPAGTAATGDIIRIYALFGATSNTNSKIYKVWINSSNSLSGATQIFPTLTDNTTSTASRGIGRVFAVRSNTSIIANGSGTAPTNISNEYSTGTTLPAAITIPTLASDVYIIFSMQRGNGGDVVSSEFAQVQISKGQ